MRALLAGVLLLAATAGCGKREVKVETTPRPTAAAVIDFIKPMSPVFVARRAMRYYPVVSSR